MAINWGPGTSVTGSGNAMRVGYELTYAPTSVTAATTAVTVTLRLYLGTRGTVSDSANAYSVTGAFTASGFRAISHTAGGTWSGSNVTLIGSWSKSVPLSYTSRETVSFSASMSGIEATPGTARVEGSIQVPLRPAQAPAAVTSLTVKRVTDNRHDLNWTRNATTAAPYDRVEVRRQNGDGASFQVIATLSGGAVSFTDASTVANRQYRYAVRPVNAGGAGAHAYTPLFYTSPAGTVVDGVQKVGTDIQAKWSRNAYEAAHYEIRDVADGVPQSQTFLTTANAWSYTHVGADPAKTHAYQVRARYVDPTVGTLISAWSPVSSAVQLQAPPAAPTNLRPSAGAVDATDEIVLSWNHNPVDTTAQRIFQVRYRVQGQAWTEPAQVVSSKASMTLPAGQWVNGQVIEWQVRTWGDHADASPWSSVAVFATSARPTATILEPTGVLNSSELVLRWSFYDAEDSVQTQARVTLRGSGNELLEERSISGSATNYRFAHRAQDGQAYTLGVQVRDGAGVWSYLASETITVTYLPPPTAEVEAIWSVETGTITVQVSHPEPTEGEVDAASCELWRSANGADWVQLASGLPLSAGVVDMIPAVEGVNHYRVVTRSSLPSTAESAPLAVPVKCRGWIYVNGGPNFSQMIRVRDNGKVDYAPSRARGKHHFAGRDWPVEVTGRSRTLGISVSVQLGGGSSTWDEIEALLDAPAPFMYRDHSRRVPVINPSLSHSHERDRRSASMSFERGDYRE